jgi:uncharacterized protein YjbJ (UPF0337 family)
LRLNWPSLYLNEIHVYNIFKMRPKGAHKAWEAQKGKLKEKFAALTDNDVLCLQGIENEMIAKLALKLGKTKEEVYQIIKAL